jgi:hypothetical protein
VRRGRLGTVCARGAYRNFVVTAYELRGKAALERAVMRALQASPGRRFACRVPSLAALTRRA